MTTTTFNVSEACAAQRTYCEQHGAPHFAPYDGVCYRCNRNIYRQYELQTGRATGISVEEAGNRLVTGCPHCYWSFCE